MFNFFKKKVEEGILKSVENLQNESDEYVLGAWESLDFRTLEGESSDALRTAMLKVEDELEKRGYVDSFGYVHSKKISENNCLNKDCSKKLNLEKSNYQNEEFTNNEENVYFINRNYKVVNGDAYFIGAIGKLVSYCHKDNRATILTDTKIEITLDASNIALA